MGSFLVLLSAFGFSTLAIFGKFSLLSGLTSHEALFWRFLFALPIFALVLALTKAFPRQSKPFFRSVLVGAVGIGIESTLFFLTLEQVGAALTGIFLYLYPAFVALISHFFMKRKLSATQWFCIGLSFVGCVMTVDYGQTRVSLLGAIYGVLTSLWYAFYLLVGERITKNENPLTVSGGITVGAFLSFLFIILFDVLVRHQELKMPDDFPQWWPILGLASIATVLPFATLYAGMKRVGAAKTSILSTLELVFTLFLAVIFLGEKLTLLQLLGATLVLLSVLLIKPLR